MPGGHESDDSDWCDVVRGQNGAVATTLDFPRYAPERRYVLSGDGTTLAVEDGPIRPHTPVLLPDGAVVRLGAWTTITLTAHPPADPAPRQTSLLVTATPRPPASR